MVDRATFAAAADALEEYGWIQGQDGNPVIGFCAGGAVSRVLGYDFDKAVEACGLLGEELRARGHTSLVIWNDTPGRTREEVVAFLREQAAAGDEVAA